MGSNPVCVTVLTAWRDDFTTVPHHLPKSIVSARFYPILEEFQGVSRFLCPLSSSNFFHRIAFGSNLIQDLFLLQEIQHWEMNS